MFYYPLAEQIFVNEVYSSRFNEVQVKFGDLRHNIVAMVIDKVPSNDDGLKKYLHRCFPGLSDELVDATSVEDTMNAVERKCSIINIVPLEAIINLYDITEAKEMIKEYKKAIDEFCSSIKLEFLLDRKLSLAISSLTCERLEFVLEWEADRYTLNDIRRLLEKAFKDFNKRIVVQSIHTGSSIVIICYAPRYLLDALFLEARNNLTALIKVFSLIQLTVAHYTVYNKVR